MKRVTLRAESFLPLRRVVQHLDELAMSDALDASSLRAILVGAVYSAPRVTSQPVQDDYESMIHSCIGAFDRLLHHEETTARELADVAWARAKLSKLVGVTGGGIFGELQRRLANAEGSDFLASDLRKLAWALALESKDSMPLFQQLGDELASRKEELSSADVATIAFSYQRAGQRHPLLFRALAERLPSCDLIPAGLAKLAAAFAGVGLDLQLSQDAFGELLSQAAKKIHGFEAQDLANLMHAVAKLSQNCKFQVKGFLKLASRRCAALCGASRARKRKLLPKDICNFAWSFAQLQSESVLPVLAGACLEHQDLRNFDPRFLSGQLCWAFGSMRVDAPQLFDAIALEVMRSRSAYQARDISVLAWSFARLGYHKPLFFDCLCGQAFASFNKFNSQDMANMLWAFSHVGIMAPSVFAKAKHFILQRISTYSLQELALVAWAFNSQADQADHLHGAVSGDMRCQLRLDSMLLGRRIAATLRHRIRSGRSQARDVKAVLRELRSSGVLDAETVLQARNELSRLAAAQDTYADSQQGATSEPAGTSKDEDEADHPRVILDLSEESVIFKPKGWEVEPTVGSAHKQLLDFVRSTSARTVLNFDALSSYGFLHRLDVVTAGLVLRAKNYRAYHNLDLQLMQGTIDREYQVLSHGYWSRRNGCVDLPIFALKGAETRPSLVATPGARPAQSIFKVLSHLSLRSKAVSFLIVQIRTGRRHQIRAHAAHVGHPVVSDGFYTSLSTFAADQAWSDCFLHRYRLAFTDMSGVRREVLSPLPPSLNAALKLAKAKSSKSVHLSKPKSFAESVELPGSRKRGGQPPHVHKPHVHQPVPRVPYELPAQTLRQEQKLLAQQTRQPQVPFTGNAPEETQTTRAIAKAVKQQKDVKHKQIEPPFVSPEAGEDVSPSPFPKPQVEVDPVKPRPPLIVRPKTSPAESNSEIGIVEDDPSPEEELLAADPEAAKLFDQLTEERVKIEERKELKKMFVPQNPPGTPKEEPSWPPSGGIAPPTQPIPARPGEANYNYGWTPPERRIPYSPPWPGGGPVTGVDRVEAVAAEVGNEASDLAHAAEDVLLNTTM